MGVTTITSRIPYQVPKASATYEPTPEGSYQGILSRVQFFGTHEQTDPKSGNKYDQLKISLVFEIDYKVDGQDKNRLISTGYPLTYSLGQKSTLAKLIRPWLGSKFPDEKCEDGLDFETMFNMSVMVGITHDTRKNKEGVMTTYDRISSLSMPPRGMPPVEWTQDQFMWSILDDLELKTAEELKMPNFLMEFAKNSKEYKEYHRQKEGKALDDMVTELMEKGGTKRQETAKPATKPDDFVPDDEIPY